MNLPAVIFEHNKLKAAIRAAAEGLSKGDAFDLMHGVAYGLAEAEAGKLCAPAEDWNTQAFHDGRNLVIKHAFPTYQGREYPSGVGKRSGKTKSSRSPSPTRTAGA